MGLFSLGGLRRDWHCQIEKAELNGKLQGVVTAGYIKCGEKGHSKRVTHSGWKGGTDVEWRALGELPRGENHFVISLWLQTKCSCLSGNCFGHIITGSVWGFWVKC